MTDAMTNVQNDAPNNVGDDALIGEILDFWFGAPGSPEHDRPRPVWFQADPNFDAAIRARFAATQARAAAGALDHLQESARGGLALVLLLDQFPRNLFRRDPRAYASDAKARAVAGRLLDTGRDRALSPIARKFLFLPFEHSETLADQNRSVALFRALAEETGDDTGIYWAERHHEIIARFGRFPHRNAVLGRETTPAEAEFLKEPNSSF